MDRRPQILLRHWPRGAGFTQVAFDHGQPVDDMTKGVVHALERILGGAIGLGLAETDVGQLAADRADGILVHPERRRTRLVQRREAEALLLEMTQNIRKTVLDASEVGGARVDRVQPLQQLHDALLDMGERRRGLTADLQMIDAVGQHSDRRFEVTGIVDRPLAAFEGGGQLRDALLQRCERTGKTVRMRHLVDFGRQHLHVVAQAGERIIRGDIGHDRAQRADRAFELLHRIRIRLRAHQHVDLVAEIANRVIEAGELFGRCQLEQRGVDIAQRLLDALQCIAVDAALAAVFDAPRHRADFVFQRFQRAPRQRFGDGLAHLREFAAEARDRLIDAVGPTQALDLAGEILQLLLEAREIGGGRGRRRHRRRGRLHHLLRALAVELVLPCNDFGDVEIQQFGNRGLWRAIRRGSFRLRSRPRLRGRGGLRDHRLGRRCRPRGGRRWRGGGDRSGLGNLRQPRIKPRNGIIELARHAGALALRR